MGVGVDEARDDRGARVDRDPLGLELVASADVHDAPVGHHDRAVANRLAVDRDDPVGRE